jgi:Holliday junction resolvasome RuvABC endonuclease subunit
MRVLGIDPDLHHAGLAIVDDSGVATRGQRPTVVWAGVALAPRKLKGYAAGLALEWPQLCDHFDEIVVEGQRIYPHSNANPEDIMRLAFAAGVAANQFRVAHEGATPYPTMIVEPAQWKGSIPKTVAHARILSRVIIWSEAAKVVAGPHASHVTDAIGIALWGLGLPGAMQQGRVRA